MKKIGFVVFLIAFAAAAFLFKKFSLSSTSFISGAPPDGIPESEVPPLDPWQKLRVTWQRPNQPPTIALQVGHLNSQDVPEELKNLRANTGASGGGYTEVQINKDIAEKTAVLLRAQGIHTEILPATVPPDYWADAFIAIHADGSTDPATSGYKIARPWRDLSGDADTLVSLLQNSYQAHTDLPIDPNITRNMRGYYAFAWWRYEHAIHPMTTAAIVETGFITNPKDRKIIVNQQDKVSKALAEGIVNFLKQQGLMTQPEG